MSGATASNPSAAIKLLRDGVPSGNLLFMETFDGQQSMDFFLPSLTTHPTPIQSETCRQTAQRKLSEASRFPFSVGSSDFASFDQDGDPTTELLYPFEVILEPTNQMRRRSSRWVSNRMTAGNNGAGYFEEMASELLMVPLRTLRNGEVDNTVWNVLARA